MKYRYACALIQEENYCKFETIRTLQKKSAQNAYHPYFSIHVFVLAALLSSSFVVERQSIALWIINHFSRKKSCDFMTQSTICTIISLPQNCDKQSHFTFISICFFFFFLSLLSLLLKHPFYLMVIRITLFYLLFYIYPLVAVHFIDAVIRFENICSANCQM